MEQAVLTGTKKFSIEDSDIPVRREENDVLVEITSVGVCGSDLHVYLGHHPKVTSPVVLGHECVGTVYEAAEGSGLLPGAPVAVMPLIGCGSCAHCLQNQPNVCANRRVIGFQEPGGLAGIIRAPSNNLVPLPKTLPTKRAILFEPLAVAAHAVSLANIEAGRPVWITGAGTIGLLVGLYLRNVFDVESQFVEINDNKRHLAERLGFRCATDVTDLLDPSSDLRPVVFECTGNLGLLESVMGILPAPSEVIAIGTFEGEASISVPMLLRHETRVAGSQMYTIEDIRRAVEVLSGPSGVRYEELIADRHFSLGDAEAAFEEALNPTGEGVKVQIKVT